MCSNDELLAKIEETEARLDTWMIRTGEEMGKIASNSYDAKVTVEANAVMVANIEKLLYLWHGEDEKKRAELWSEIGSIKSWKAKIIGTVTGAVLIASAFISGIAWAIHYSWNWLVKAFH